VTDSVVHTRANGGAASVAAVRNVAARTDLFRRSPASPAPSATESVFGRDHAGLIRRTMRSAARRFCSMTSDHSVPGSMRPSNQSATSPSRSSRSRWESSARVHHDRHARSRRRCEVEAASSGRILHTENAENAEITANARGVARLP
jgi:hypothetical protein